MKSHSITHERHMRHCLDLARRAREGGDTPVGAIVVRNGEVVAEGIEAVRQRGDVTAHAEIEAIRAACLRLGTTDLHDCTLYTTVEPCVMCAWALRLARVATLVSGARLRDGDESTLAWKVLTDENLLPRRPVPAVIRDLLGEECRAMLG